MKTQFTKGEGHVQIKYGSEPVPKHFRGKDKQPPFPENVRTTTLTVTLPGSEVLTAKIKCDSRDQFIKKAGRFYAFLKLIDADTEQAEQRALDAYKSKALKSPETEEGLAAAARGYYKICREDRRALFAITCPEFSRNTPERRAIREKALFERLKAKYDAPKTKVGKTIKLATAAPALKVAAK